MIIRFFDKLRFVLIGLMIVLGLLSSMIPHVIRSMDEALERATRHDVAWNGMHGRNEQYELTRRVLLFAAKGTQDDHDAALLAYDILQSRIATWNSGSFRRFVDAGPDRRATLDDIADRTRIVGGYVKALDKPENLLLAIEALGELEPRVEKLSSQAFTRSTIELAENNARMRNLQFLQQVLIIALTGTGFVLVSLLLVQNWLLGKSNRAQKASSDTNAYLAAHDLLTGLPNRSKFHAEFERACGAQPADGYIVVFTIDLDGFKPVNDVLGHRAGDLLLVEVARRLVALTAERPPSMASRFGGDEFTLFFAGITDRTQAQGLASEILARLREPSDIDSHHIVVDATIGVCVHDDPATTPADLINRADIALNWAKNAGKGRVALFEPRMLDGIVARRRTEAEMAVAEIGSEFEPHYQPIINLATGEVVAVEALARWIHPERGMISPAEFIPVAESSGLIVDIGCVILEKACRDAMLFQKPVAVSVNISAVQLIRSDIVTTVADVLKRSGLPAGRLKLEITESVLIHDAKGTRQLVKKLQNMGITVSLDDFGTGYSSLSYLRDFGFDELKIDRSFVKGLGEDMQAGAIVQTILGLSASLQMSVVAEGIETAEQAALLKLMGCTRGQGYLFGKPVPAARMFERLSGKATPPTLQIAS